MGSPVSKNPCNHVDNKQKIGGTVIGRYVIDLGQIRFGAISALIHHGPTQ